jgi:hypothetical protein
MSTQSTVQITTAGRRFAGLGSLAIVLGLALGLISFAAYRVAPSPAPAGIPQVSVAQDAAQQGVMGYIQAHSVAAPALAADPSQQGVTSYLKAHGAGEPRPAAWAPMVRAVLDYLRAHGWYAD